MFHVKISGTLISTINILDFQVVTSFRWVNSYRRCEGFYYLNLQGKEELSLKKLNFYGRVTLGFMTSETSVLLVDCLILQVKAIR